MCVLVQGCTRTVALGVSPVSPHRSGWAWTLSTATAPGWWLSPGAPPAQPCPARPPCPGEGASLPAALRTCCFMHLADKTDGGRGGSSQTRRPGREGPKRAAGVQDLGAGGEHVWHPPSWGYWRGAPCREGGQRALCRVLMKEENPKHPRATTSVVDRLLWQCCGRRVEWGEL